MRFRNPLHEKKCLQLLWESFREPPSISLNCFCAACLCRVTGGNMLCMAGFERGMREGEVQESSMS